jgi:magnesium chelatase subunit ChlI-like protein
LILARRLTTILPAMTLPKAIETTRIHRVAVLTGARTVWVTARPFRAPHYTISDVGLLGGGQVPLPGDVSRAHHGVRFLDELPEFKRHVLDVGGVSQEVGLSDPPAAVRPPPHTGALPRSSTGAGRAAAAGKRPEADSLGGRK